MERYFMEPEDTLSRRFSYAIFDRRRGRSKERGDSAIAMVSEAELAQRIVNLLNADAARLERQGAVAS